MRFVWPAFALIVGAGILVVFFDYVQDQPAELVGTIDYRSLEQPYGDADFRTCRSAL